MSLFTCRQRRKPRLWRNDGHTVDIGTSMGPFGCGLFRDPGRNSQSGRTRSVACPWFDWPAASPCEPTTEGISHLDVSKNINKYLESVTAVPRSRSETDFLLPEATPYLAELASASPRFDRVISRSHASLGFALSNDKAPASCYGPSFVTETQWNGHRINGLPCMVELTLGLLIG